MSDRDFSMYSSDTIVALATPLGVGAIGIVRLSGPGAFAIARQVFRPASGRFPSADDSHKLVYGHIVDPSSGEMVDEILLAAMWGPRTYTREDMVEINCHGGVAAQRAVVKALVDAGARPAEPGEFTRRAFLNGRIDLAQAEAVAAICRARSRAALRASLRQLGGGVSARVRSCRRRLIGILAQLEAQIDFSDEDPGELDPASLTGELEDVAGHLEALLSTAFAGRVLDQGLRVAIVGRPNVGKSSLLNALASRERAIVSEIPGTTRDTVEEAIEIAGFSVCLVDTAGLRHAGDVVEQEGVRRSRAALEEADLVLAVTDWLAVGSEPPALDGWLLGDLGLDPEHTIVVLNKADLVCTSGEEVEKWDPDEERLRTVLVAEGLLAEAEQERDIEGAEAWECCVVSAKEGWGISALRDLIRSRVENRLGVHLDEPILTSERQRRLVADSVGYVLLAQENLAAGLSEEIIAEDLRAAAYSLGLLTGEELVEDLLDEVFSRFCIGK